MNLVFRTHRVVPGAPPCCFVPQVVQRALGVAYLSIYHREGGGRVVLYDIKQGKVRKRRGWSTWHYGRGTQGPVIIAHEASGPGRMRSFLVTCRFHTPVLWHR